jgi:hypothetical protein
VQVLFPFLASLLTVLQDIVHDENAYLKQAESRDGGGKIILLPDGSCSDESKELTGHQKTRFSSSRLVGCYEHAQQNEGQA